MCSCSSPDDDSALEPKWLPPSLGEGGACGLWPCLGGAVAASVSLAIYAEDLIVGLTDSRVPPPAVATAEDGVAQALTISRELGPDGAKLATAALDAFASGYGAALWVAASTLVIGAIVALVGSRSDVGDHAASSVTATTGADLVLEGQP